MQRAQRFPTFLLALSALVFTSASCAASELVVAVTALDQQQISVSGIRFTYQGVESPPTTDAGMTNFSIPLGVGQDIPPGAALEFGLPGSLAKTWFLIDDTVHVPGPGEPPAEVVLMKRADIRRLAERVRDAPPPDDRELSPLEQKQRRLEVARELGLSSEEELAAAIAAFRETAEDPMDEGVALFLAREYAQAEPFFMDALSHAEEDLIEAAQYLGQSRFYQGKYLEAAEAFRKALGVREADDTLLLTWSALALHHSGEVADAEALLRRALVVDESEHGPDSVIMAKRLNNLATLLQRTHREYEAETMLRRALGIVEAEYGPDHPEIVVYLNNLAALLNNAHRLTEAEQLFRRSIAVTESQHERDYQGTTGHYKMLAALLQETNRPAKAEDLLRRGLEMSQSIHGPDHPSVAGHLYQLANLLASTDRLVEAEPLIRRALEIWETHLWEGHPMLAAARKNLEAMADDREVHEGQAIVP